MVTALILAFSLYLAPAEAHEAAKVIGPCENLLHSEFSRRPDDLRNGLISEHVPLSISSLINAYKQGIFPWGVNSNGMGRWHRPPYRGILELDKVHVSSKDQKYLRQQERLGELTVTFDQAFTQVIEECATVPRFRTDASTGEKLPDGAWITKEFLDTYKMLHSLGFAHSVEVWRGDKLVAGLYGVFVEGVFTGESMFYHEPDATKLAFHALIERLKANGHKFIDTQMALGLALKWGARYVPRADYDRRMREAQASKLKF